MECGFTLKCVRDMERTGNLFPPRYNSKGENVNLQIPPSAISFPKSYIKFPRKFFQEIQIGDTLFNNFVQSNSFNSERKVLKLK